MYYWQRLVIEQRVEEDDFGRERIKRGDASYDAVQSGGVEVICLRTRGVDLDSGQVYLESTGGILCDPFRHEKCLADIAIQHVQSICRKAREDRREPDLPDLRK